MNTLIKALGITQIGDRKKIYVSHLTVRESISILILKIILLDIITAALFMFSHSFFFNTDISQNLGVNVVIYNNTVFSILVILKISMTIYLVFAWLNEFYEITPEYILYKKGIFFRRVKKHDIALIRSLKVKHGIIGRLLNFGTISLLDIRLNTDINLYMIHNPLKYLRILEELIPDLEEDRKFFREEALEDKKGKY